MSNVKKLSVAFTQDMASILKGVVENGEYGSVSEVVREAMRDWKYKYDQKQAEIEYLREAWRVGIESGKGQFDSIDDLLKEARARHEKQNG